MTNVPAPFDIEPVIENVLFASKFALIVSAARATGVRAIIKTTPTPKIKYRFILFLLCTRRIELGMNVHALRIRGARAFLYYRNYRVCEDVWVAAHTRHHQAPLAARAPTRNRKYGRTE